ADGAERTRTEAEALLASRVSEAEAKSAELVAAAEARASSTLDTAAAEAEALVENARRQGREMLDEAKSARERVLGDLVRRRSLLNSQIEALRGGRDRLLDAYRTVKRTFLDATEALQQVEARVAVERSASSNEAIDVAAEIAAEIEKLDIAVPGELGDATDTAVPGDADAGGERAPAEDTETDVASALADVDTLFARLRAGHDDPEPGAGRETEATDAVPASATAGTTAFGAEVERCSAEEWRARRAKAIDPLLPALLKRAK